LIANCPNSKTPGAYFGGLPNNGASSSQLDLSNVNPPALVQSWATDVFGPSGEPVPSVNDTIDNSRMGAVDRTFIEGPLAGLMDAQSNGELSHPTPSYFTDEYYASMRTYLTYPVEQSYPIQDNPTEETPEDDISSSGSCPPPMDGSEDDFEKLFSFQMDSWTDNDDDDTTLHAEREPLILSHRPEDEHSYSYMVTGSDTPVPTTPPGHTSYQDR